MLTTSVVLLSAVLSLSVVAKADFGSQSTAAFAQTITPKMHIDTKQNHSS